VGGAAEPPAATEVLTGLLLDEMYPPALAQRLRDHGHDVLAALDIQVGLASRSDEDVLAWASGHDRCVVIENVRDFARLTALGEHSASNTPASCSFRHSGSRGRQTG
jgi:Domain of unknown function (DUF5615)